MAQLWFLLVLRWRRSAAWLTKIQTTSSKSAIAMPLLWALNIMNERSKIPKIVANAETAAAADHSGYRYGCHCQNFKIAIAWRLPALRSSADDCCHWCTCTDMAGIASDGKKGITNLSLSCLSDRQPLNGCTTSRPLTLWMLDSDETVIFRSPKLASRYC